jgi:MoxR-like ATPase
MSKKFTERLGIYGWSQLDPVLLAGLALRTPVLLVGAHGTGKSLLIERMARALCLSFRHYNASLMNYDDLIGIPIPENGSLRFVASPGGIWGAEFVFFDEISRCRPDLQNKLFPIIYERKVAGIDLANLQHRWAAMNPPASLDMSDAYIGSEPIDLALADRFQFVVQTPAWKDMDRNSHHKIVSAEEPGDRVDGIIPLVAECRRRINLKEPELRYQICDYVVSFLDLLHKTGYSQSPRRARMLVSGIIAISAALDVLGFPGNTLEQGANLAARYGLPLYAQSDLPPTVRIFSAHKQAWDLARLTQDKRWRSILLEPDPLERINLADDLDMSDEDISRVITRALSSEESDARCAGLSVILFLRFRAKRNLTPGTWEMLVKKSDQVLTPGTRSTYLPSGKNRENWDRISTWKSDQPSSFQGHLETCFVLSGFPELWQKTSWRAALEQFRKDMVTLRMVGGDNEITQ